MAEIGSVVGRYVRFSVLAALLVATAESTHAAEVGLVSGPWPESVPPVATKDAGSPPLFTPVDLTVVEETLTIEAGDRHVTIMGEALNDSEMVVGTPRLSAAMVDGDGELIAVATASMEGAGGVASREFFSEWVAPGETALFAVTLVSPDGRPVESVLLRASGTGFDAPKDASAPLEMVGDWEVEVDGWSLTLTGRVRNSTPEDVVGLRTVLALREPSGGIVEYSRLPQRGERIGGYVGGVPAGGEVDVEVWFYMDPEVFAASSIETRLNALRIGDDKHLYAVIGIAHLRGLDGSEWRSTLHLVNRSRSAGRALVKYRHEGGEAFAWVDLEIGEAVHLEDVAVELFGVEDPSSGYLFIASNVPLRITGRTSNETVAGGYGQALPVVTPGMTYDFDPTEGVTGVLVGLRGGSSFRTNIGLVNLGGEVCSARVVVFDTTGRVEADWGRVELGSAEWRQVNDAIGETLDSAYATVEPEPGCPIWAYASVIEESTGDPVTVALQRETEIDLRPEPGGFRIFIRWEGE